MLKPGDCNGIGEKNTYFCASSLLDYFVSQSKWQTQ